MAQIITNDLRIITNDGPSSFDEEPSSMTAIQPSQDDPESQPLPNVEAPKTLGLTEGVAWFSIVYNVVVHIIMYGMTIYFTVISFHNEDPYSIFCWHVPFSLLGYSILMTESMLCFSNTNLLTRRLTHRSQVYVHWLLQVAAAIFITSGLFAAVIRKYQRNKSHFKSYHAQFGIAAIAITVVTMLSGLPTKYSFRLRKFLRPVYTKISHTALAFIAYGLAVVSMLCGLYTGWFRHYSLHPSIFYMAFVGVLFVAQYVVYHPVENLWGRIVGLWRERHQ